MRCHRPDVARPSSLIGAGDRCDASGVPALGCDCSVCTSFSLLLFSHPIKVDVESMVSSDLQRGSVRSVLVAYPLDTSMTVRGSDIRAQIALSSEFTRLNQDGVARYGAVVAGPCC